MKLVVINGTPRKFGRTRVVAKYIADQFEGELYDLAIEELPLYNGEESQRDLEAVKIENVSESCGWGCIMYTIIIMR